MRTPDFLRLVIRVIAVFLSFHGLAKATSLLSYFWGRAGKQPMLIDIMYVLWVFLILLLAFLCWFFPNRLYFIFTGRRSGDGQIKIGFLRGEFVLWGVGLYFFVSSLLDFIYFIGELLTYRFLSGWWSSEHDVYINILVGFFGVCAGWGMVFYSRTIVVILTMRR